MPKCICDCRITRWNEAAPKGKNDTQIKLLQAFHTLQKLCFKEPLIVFFNLLILYCSPMHDWRLHCSDWPAVCIFITFHPMSQNQHMLFFFVFFQQGLLRFRFVYMHVTSVLACSLNACLVPFRDLKLKHTESNLCA